MRIYQMLPKLLYGDAIGSDAMALMKALKENGYKTAIYAESIDERMIGPDIKRFSHYKDNEEDVIIYHLSIGDEMNERIRKLKARKIFLYHNITPAHFFKEYDSASYKTCLEGMENVKSLKNIPRLCITESEYNKSCLKELGYECPIEVLPILIKFKEYEKKPDMKLMKRLTEDGYVNIMFAGRIAPNKKQEDLIAAFNYYNKYINKKSRLILVGGYRPQDIYYRKLKKYQEELKLKNVIFTGHIAYNKLLAYYRTADVFVCLSEHEGFCVPVVEAMYFNKPVIAYDSTAVGETLSRAGLFS